MDIKLALIVFGILLVVDLVWLSLFLGPVFGEMVGKIQGSPMRVNTKYAAVSYLLLGLAIYYFSVQPTIQNLDMANPMTSLLRNSLWYGGLLGLIVYGVFDFTNLAIFSDYSLQTGTIDTLWGGFLFTLVTALSVGVTQPIIVVCREN